MTRVTLTAAALVLAAGCGSATSPELTQGTGTPQSEVASYQSLAQKVQSAAASYGSSVAAQSMSSLAACRTLHNAYDAEVRPWIIRMNVVSSEMDRLIDQRGGAAYADIGCAAAGMLSELDHHAAIACSYANLSDDRTEAARDVNAMQGYALHISGRCGEMMSGLSCAGCMMHWGPMMQGCAGWHGGMMGGQ